MPWNLFGNIRGPQGAAGTPAEVSRQVMLTADATAVASTTLTSVGLSITSLPAGTWWFDFKIFANVLTTAQAIRASLIGPAQSSLRISKLYQSGATAPTWFYASAYDDAGNSASVAIGANCLVEVSGRVVATATGNLEMRLARTAVTGSVVAKAGSFGTVVACT